ncbi:MAG: DUF4375 domain-containing protein [Bacteroidia bacterium]
MKIAIGIFAVLIIGVALLYSLKKSNSSKKKSQSTKQAFFSLDDGNQDSLIFYSTVSQNWVDSTKAKFDWENFDEYDNRMWEYMSKLFDDVIAESSAEDYNELWEKLNRPQKVFWSFLAFNGDTDNGGVYQFIFNRPEFLFAVAEMWEEIGAERVAKDYAEVLKELTGKSGKISELKTAFNSETNSWEQRWESFTDGYDELESTDIIEDYYFDEVFKKECHKKMADYIEQNMDMFRK